MSAEPHLWFLDLCIGITFILGCFCFAIQPKEDRRFRTGYRDNQKPNTQAIWLGFISFGIALLLWWCRP